MWLSAKQLSDISAAINLIVINVYVYSLFGDPAILGLVLALRMLGTVLGAFLVPLLSGRISHLAILVGTDLGSATLMTGMSLTPQGWDKHLILVLPFFIGLFHGGFHVSLYSQAQEFLGRESRHLMNGILSSIDGIAVVVGGFLAGILYYQIPIKVIFFIDAVTFSIAGIVFWVVGRNLVASAGSSSDGTLMEPCLKRKQPFSWSLVKILMGYSGLIVVARFVEAFGSSTHNVGFPILSAEYAPDNEALLMGWIMGSWGIGKILATVWVPSMIHRLERQNWTLEHVFVALLVATFICFLGVFTISALVPTLMLACIAGFFDAGTEMSYYSSLQSTSDNIREWLISSSYLIERVGMGLGILIVSYSFAELGIHHTVQLFYLGAISMCLVIAIVLRQMQKRGSMVRSFPQEKCH